jgi:hypothetical protein
MDSAPALFGSFAIEETLLAATIWTRAFDCQLRFLLWSACLPHSQGSSRAEAFTRRAQASGFELGTTARGGQLSLQTLLEEPDFTVATFLLCVREESAT